MHELQTYLRLAMMRWAVQQLPEKDRTEVESHAALIRSLVKDDPNAMIAMALVGMELAASTEGKDDPKV